MRDAGETLGRKVKEWRMARGYSQAELAVRAGVDQSFVSHVEIGKIGQPSIEYLRKLAGGLDIALSQLLLASGYLTPEELHRSDDPELATMIAVMREDPDFIAQIARLGGDRERVLRDVVAAMRGQLTTILNDRERRGR